MAVTTLNDLPPVLSLNGSEICFMYQYDPLLELWITYSCTTGQIASLASQITGAGTVSMRQLLAAMASQGVLVTAFESVPADITNTYNIAWNHAYRMGPSDTFVTGFLQPTIGYTNGQMAVLFVLAAGLPV